MRSISIIIANYNNEDYLPTAIRSVLNQTYSNFELIIIDDNSSDNSQKIISKFLLKDERIHYFKNNRNYGYGYSLKKGIDLATAKIIGRVDSDDAIEPDAFEVMIAAFDKHPEASLIYSNYFFCDKDLNVVSQSQLNQQIPEGETYLTQTNNSCNISHFACFRSDAYYRTPGLDPSFKRAVDKDLYYKLEEVGESVFIDKALYYYRQHMGSISLFDNQTKAIWWEIRAKKKAYKRRLTMKEVPNITRFNVREAYKNFYHEMIYRNLKEKKYCHLLGNFLLLLFYYPKVFANFRFAHYILNKSLFPAKFIN